MKLSLTTLFATLCLFTLPSAAKPQASATTTTTPTPTSCSVSSTSVCCQSFTTASNPSAAYLIREFGIRGTTGSTKVGLTCTTIYNSRQAKSCTGDTLCCSHDYGGLIATDCSAVDL